MWMCVCVCVVHMHILVKSFQFQDVTAAAVVGVCSHVLSINKRLDFVHVLFILALASHLHFLCALCRTKQSIRPLELNFLAAHRHKLYASSYSACAYILDDFVLLSMPIGFNSCCHCESFVITMCVSACVCVLCAWFNILTTTITSTLLTSGYSFFHFVSSFSMLSMCMGLCCSRFVCSKSHGNKTNNNISKLRLPWNKYQKVAKAARKGKKELNPSTRWQFLKNVVHGRLLSLGSPTERV